jgi:hypothetical protein
LRFAQLCSVVVNLVQGAVGGKGKKTKPEDFLLDFEKNWATVAEHYPLVDEFADLFEDEDEDAPDEAAEVSVAANRGLVEMLTAYTSYLTGTPVQPPTQAPEGEGAADLGDTGEPAGTLRG